MSKYSSGPNLRVVATMSVGFEHIDVEECKKRNIRVCNTPNVSTDSVAELTVSLLLLTARRLLEGKKRNYQNNFVIIVCTNVLHETGNERLCRHRPRPPTWRFIPASYNIQLFAHIKDVLFKLADVILSNNTG